MMNPRIRSPVRLEKRSRSNEPANRTDEVSISTEPPRRIVQTAHSRISAAPRHLHGWSSAEKILKQSRRSGQRCKPSKRNRSIGLEPKLPKLPMPGSKPNLDYGNFDSKRSEERRVGK